MKNIFFQRIILKPKFTDIKKNNIKAPLGESSAAGGERAGLVPNSLSVTLACAPANNADIREKSHFRCDFCFFSVFFCRP